MSIYSRTRLLQVRLKADLIFAYYEKSCIYLKLLKVSFGLPAAPRPNRASNPFKGKAGVESQECVV